MYTVQSQWTRKLIDLRALYGWPLIHGFQDKSYHIWVDRAVLSRYNRWRDLM